MISRNSIEVRDYLCITGLNEDGSLKLVSLSQFKQVEGKSLSQTRREQPVFTTRTSPSVGMPTCKDGNRGPKDKQSVLIVVGLEGLKAALTAGFVPHVCLEVLANPTQFKEEMNQTLSDGEPAQMGHRFIWPEGDNEMEEVGSLIRELQQQGKIGDYNTFDIDQFRWEEIARATRGLPDRIYLPHAWRDDFNWQEGVDSSWADDKETRLPRFVKRITALAQELDVVVPQFGWYDSNAPHRFRVYNLKGQ